MDVAQFTLLYLFGQLSTLLQFVFYVLGILCCLKYLRRKD